MCVFLPGGGSGAGVSAAAGGAGELPAAGGRQTQPACCCPPPGHTAAGVLAAVSLSHVQGNCNMFKSWYCPSPPCRVSWMVLWVESGPTLMIWGAAWSCSSSTSGWSTACRSCSLWALNVSHSSPTQSSTAELSSSSSSAATRSDRKHSSQSFVMHVIKKITF